MKPQNIVKRKIFYSTYKPEKKKNKYPPPFTRQNVLPNMG